MTRSRPGALAALLLLLLLAAAPDAAAAPGACAAFTTALGQDAEGCVAQGDPLCVYASARTNAFIVAATSCVDVPDAEGCVEARGTSVVVHPSCAGGPEAPILPGMGPSCPPPPPQEPPPRCCDGGPCCDPQTAECQAAMVVVSVRRRVGADLGERGVCFDAGQREDGSPYVSVDPQRSCTAPPGGA